VIKYSSVFVVLLSLYFFSSNFSKLVPILGYYNQIIVVFLIIIQFFFLYDQINTKSIVLISLVLLFQGSYIFYGAILHGDTLDLAIKNSRYLLVFFLFPSFIHLTIKNELERLLKPLSFIMTFKVMVVFVIILDLSFGEMLSKSYMYEYSEMLVHPYLGVYRVFDSFIIFFPLVFYAAKYFNLILKVFIHVILFVYVIFSFAVGMYFVYVIVAIFYASKKVIFCILCVLISACIIFDVSQLFDLVLRVYHSKMDDSVGVKAQQVYWIVDNISLFGIGVGYVFNINGRIDTMLENLHIYWLATYGIIGASLFYFFTVVTPTYIYIRYQKINDIKVVFTVYASSLLASLVNPFALSGMVFMFLVMLISYSLTHNKNSTSFYNN